MILSAPHGYGVVVTCERAYICERCIPCLSGGRNLGFSAPPVGFGSHGPRLNGLLVCAPANGLYRALPGGEIWDSQPPRLGLVVTARG